MAIKKNNMSKEDLIGALTKSAAEKAGRLEEDYPNYVVETNALTDIKHYTKTDYQAALAYFKDIAAGNETMNKIAYRAIETCINNNMI